MTDEIVLVARNRLVPAVIRDHAKIKVYSGTNLTQILGDARAVCLWDLDFKGLKNAWDCAKHPGWIHVASTGVDRLWFDSLREAEVTITNSRGVFDSSLAEYALASVLRMTKQLGETQDYQFTKEWNRRETVPFRGSKVLFVGAGSSASAAATIFRSVGAQVTACASAGRLGDQIFPEIFDAGSLAERIGEFDHVVILAPLTTRTRGLFDGTIFSSMKEGSTLTNLSRGAIINETSLLDALEGGPLLAATVDTTVTEPLPRDSALWSAKNLLVSPHMAGVFPGWELALANVYLENLRRWLTGEILLNTVDRRREY